MLARPFRWRRTFGYVFDAFASALCSTRYFVQPADGSQEINRPTRVNSNRSCGALSQARNEVPSEAHSAAFLLASLFLRRHQTDDAINFVTPHSLKGRKMRVRPDARWMDSPRDYRISFALR